MITLFRPNIIYALTQVKEAMAAYIRQLPSQIAPVGTPLKILRYELPCEPVNILAWLHNQKTDTKVYWSGRDGDFEMGGVGRADILKGTCPIDYRELFAYMEDRLSVDNPRLRYYGGIGFSHSCDGTDWREFGTYQFIIPRFELFQSEGQAVFAFNIALNDIDRENIETILTVLEQLDFSSQTTYRKVPQMLSRADFPDKEGWDAVFSAVRNAAGGVKCEKVVLARKSVFDFDVALRPDALLKHLKDRTPDCFHFCFQPCGGAAFLGATPERLYKREKQGLQSEAIAGTRPRGKDGGEDAELEIQLVNSSKDALEHRYVADAVRAALEPFCRSLKFDEIFRLKKLKGSQHLVTGFEGELNEGVCDHQILASLHPTPAVAGWPANTAMDIIGQMEPFSRGWYAGPVGYVGYDTTEFAVAIRSGLIRENQLSLYAGAGIVAGSTPAGEWAEIENKVSNFIKVFDKR